MMDQMDAARLAALTPQERAQKLAGQANDYLDRGLLLEAERLYQAAVAADKRAAVRTQDWLKFVSERGMQPAHARRLTPHWNWSLRPMRTWCWAGWILRLAT